MPAPTPVQCPSTEYDWVTPAGVPTWDQMLRMLDMHAQMVHGLSATGANPGNTDKKFEKLPRPSFTLNMTERDWAFTKMQWDSYISQSTTIQVLKKSYLN